MAPAGEGLLSMSAQRTLVFNFKAHCMNSRMTLLLTLATSAVLSTPAWAVDLIALDSTRGTGNQGWAGVLGMDFDVGAAGITVTQLGAFDSDQNGFVGSIQVGIFDRVTSALVGTSVTLTGTLQTLTGQQRFFDVADFNLAAGQYSIVAVGFSAADPNGNTQPGGVGPIVGPTPTVYGGSLLTFVNSSRYDFSTSLVYPGIADAGPAGRYDAGTFQFTSVVPEPSGYALAFAALGLMGGVGLFKRRI